MKQGHKPMEVERLKDGSRVVVYETIARQKFAIKCNGVLYMSPAMYSLLEAEADEALERLMYSLLIHHEPPGAGEALLGPEKAGRIASGYTDFQ